MIRFASGLLAVCTVLLSMSQAGDDKKTFANTPDELKLFELINAERMKKELPLLKLNPLLSKIARAHSENMARQGKMEHKLDNMTPFDRMRGAGYKFAKGAENIAQANKKATLPMVMKSWMDSPAHRENVLLSEFSEIGVGIGSDKDGERYFTQLFARPLR
jgi:uncharacterized protein YkwD